jgi:hypothetical protein
MSGPVSITEINTSVTIIDRTIMPALIEDEGAVFAAISRDAIRRADQRDYIISILLEIAEATTLALSEADIRIPVFFAVPRSGDSIITFATPIDPCKADWRGVCDIIRGIVETKVGLENLNTR